MRSDRPPPRRVRVSVWDAPPGTPLGRGPVVASWVVRAVGAFATLGLAAAFALPGANVLGVRSVAPARAPSSFVLAPAVFVPSPRAVHSEPWPEMSANRLHLGGPLDTVDCPAPALADGTATAQASYYESIGACLSSAWYGPLTRARIQPRDLQVVVFSRTGSGPCGSFGANRRDVGAFYCPADETVYIHGQLLARAFPARDHIAYGLILAHEYGHHVQAMAGILDARGRAGYEARQRDAELSRRTEAQAWCFAGMFLSAIAGSYPVGPVQRATLDRYASSAFGDDTAVPAAERTHGSAATQAAWIERGMLAEDVSSCNTWSVAEADVA